MERIAGDRMAKVKGIIFDLDGTLVRLPVDWRRVLNTIEEMLGTKVKSLIGLYAEIWGTKTYEAVSRKVEEFEMASLNKMEILDDSPKLLKSLSTKYFIGLVTFQSRKVARKIIERIGVEEIVIATRDDSPTRADQISLIISSTSLNPRDFLIVGDRLNDVYSALRVGCNAVLVDRTGRNLQNEKEFIVIQDLKALPKIIREIE
ncbi:HAD family hydrolase [Candidatus Bathyarchaeota archaeon]|nr:HAD family hydrolase [Candidatus Bathyarchaeota archaeon]